MNVRDGFIYRGLAKKKIKRSKLKDWYSRYANLFLLLVYGVFGSLLIIITYLYLVRHP